MVKHISLNVPYQQFNGAICPNHVTYASSPNIFFNLCVCITWEMKN